MKTCVVGLFIMWACVATAFAQQPATGAAEDAVRKVVADYNRALNACDVEGIVRMFEPDAMRMPANQPPTIGQQNLRTWFTNYCSRTTAKLAFIPLEVEVSGNVAWTRVDIGGNLTATANGAVNPQDNQGILIIRRSTDGVWRIARYINNSKRPLPAAPPARTSN